MSTAARQLGHLGARGSREAHVRARESALSALGDRGSSQIPGRALDSGAVAADDPDVRATSTAATLRALLDAAAARIVRLEPIEALTAIRTGGLLVDIRSEPDRSRDGVVPGSLHIPRTVLEWRLAPDSSWRSPHVGDLDQQIVLMCDHGCASILAAATLVDLGFTRAGDVIGGFAAWRAAGLPSVPAQPTDHAAGALPGMHGPDD